MQEKEPLASTKNDPAIFKAHIEKRLNSMRYTANKLWNKYQREKNERITKDSDLADIQAKISKIEEVREKLLKLSALIYLSGEQLKGLPEFSWETLKLSPMDSTSPTSSFSSKIGGLFKSESESVLSPINQLCKNYNDIVEEIIAYCKRHFPSVAPLKTHLGS